MILNPFRFGASVPPDPFFSSVKLLALATEADGSTTPADSSLSARTITSVNGAAVTKTAPKFTGSLQTSITGSKYFSVAHSTDFNIASGAYTVDFWLYLTSLPTVGNPFFTLFSKGQDAGNGPWLFLFYQSDQQFIYFRNNATELVTPVKHNMNINTWYHIEVSRASASTTNRIRKDGVTLTTGTGTIVDNSARTLLIGSYQNSSASPLHFANAKFEDFRWTAGVQRNASDFTPPTTKAPAY